MKKQSLLKGSLILGTAGIITRFLGLFFRWPLIMLIGDEGIGYYQMSYPLYMFFVAMSSGVPIAISKLISENNVKGDFKNNFVVIRESIILMLILGGGTSCILLFFSSQIIEFLRWDYKAYYSLIGISLAPLIISTMMVFRGFFQGYQNMNYSAISQILEQLGRITFGVGLAIILLPKGVEFSAGGAAFGAAAGGVASGIFLFSKYKKMKKNYEIQSIKNNPEVLSKILKIAIPISLGATVGTIMSLIDSILVPHKLIEAGFSSTQATILYAQLTGKAAVIVNIPLTLTMALCTSLIPIIAEVYLLRRQKEIEKKVNLALKLSSFIAIPCLFGLFFLSVPIINFIFPGRAEGSEILKYLSLSIPFIVITQTTTSILQGLGKYIIPIVTLFIGCIIKIGLTMILVNNPQINVYGAVIATVSAYTIVAIMNLLIMKITLKIKMKLYENFVKPMYASCIMMMFVLISYNMIFTRTLSNSLACLLSISLGAIIYIVSIILLKVFKIEDVKNKLRK